MYKRVLAIETIGANTVKKIKACVCSFFNFPDLTSIHY